MRQEPPTDSVLRRHFEQHAAAAPQAPEDSVLRRHYRQLIGEIDIGAKAAAPVRPASVPASETTAKLPASAALKSPTVATKPEPKGWLAQLAKKLFGT